MKRIYIQNDRITGGGVENVLFSLAEYLSHHYKVTLAASIGDRKQFYSLYSRKIRYIKRRRTVSGEKRLIAHFFEKIVCKAYNFAMKIFLMFARYDIAIAFKEGPDMSDVAKMNADLKFGWVHVDYNYLYWTKNTFLSEEEEKKCMQKYSKIVCVSEAAAESIKNVIGDPGNLCVRYNPVNYKKIRMMSEEKYCIKKEPDKLYMVSVGRLCEEKNYGLLINVCAQLEQELDFELWIIGDGEKKEDLENQILDLGVKSVKLLGQHENPYPCIKAADLYISSSSGESYGLAIQEALILGVPVVAVTCPALEETVDPRFGILVKNSEMELKKAILKMAGQSKTKRKYSSRIKKYYNCEEFYEKRLKEIVDLWEKM